MRGRRDWRFVQSAVPLPPPNPDNPLEHDYDFVSWHEYVLKMMSDEEWLEDCERLRTAVDGNEVTRFLAESKEEMEEMRREFRRMAADGTLDLGKTYTLRELAKMR